MTDAAPRKDVPDSPEVGEASAPAADAPPEPSGSSVPPSDGEPERVDVPAVETAEAARTEQAVADEQPEQSEASAQVERDERAVEQPELAERAGQFGQSAANESSKSSMRPNSLDQVTEAEGTGESPQVTPSVSALAAAAMASNTPQQVQSSQLGTPSASPDQATADQPSEPAKNPTVTWSSDQPAPAPWFLGRPGQTPPPGWVSGPPQNIPPQNVPPRNMPPGVPPYGHGQPPHPQAGPQNGAPQSGAPQSGGPQSGGPQSGGPQASGPQFGTHAGPRSGEQPGQANRQPGGPSGGPGQPQRPRREPVRPGEQPKRPPLSLKTRWARGLALGGATCTLLALLYGYQSFPAWLVGAGVGLAFAIAGLWLGAFAQREAANAGQRAPEAIASIVWCVISAVLSLGIIAASLAMYPQLKQYAHCERTSNTVSEQQACVDQFKKSWPFNQSTAGGSAIR